MTVYLVIYSHWDDTKVEGAYASSEAARKAYPTLKWKPNAQPGCFYVGGLPYGQAMDIEPHVVHGSL